MSGLDLCSPAALFGRTVEEEQEQEQEQEEELLTFCSKSLDWYTKTQKLITDPVA